MSEPPLSNLNVPDDLSELDQWVLWKFEKAGSRTAKIPYSVRGHRASSTDPDTWASFDEVARTWRRDLQRYTGLGFVFVEQGGIAGIDLDRCLERDGRPKHWARGVVERFSDSYIEISPSGTGLKIWARGTLPHNVAGVPVGDGAIEMYDHARYFTVTGRVFSGAPLQVEDHSNDLLRLYGRLAGGREGRWPLQPMQGGRIPHGQQHNTLVSLAGTLRARRVCEEAIEACLQTVNRSQCERPGSPENITAMVRSTRKWKPE